MGGGIFVLPGDGQIAASLAGLQKGLKGFGAGLVGGDHHTVEFHPAQVVALVKFEVADVYFEVLLQRLEHETELLSVRRHIEKGSQIKGALVFLTGPERFGWAEQGGAIVFPYRFPFQCGLEAEEAAFDPVTGGDRFRCSG